MLEAQHHKKPALIAAVNRTDNTAGVFTQLSIKFIDNRDILFHFHISKRTLEREWHKELPYIRIGKKTYYEENDLLKFLASHKSIPGRKQE